MIALHRHDTNDGRLFTETMTGLDHGGFAVPSRLDLELWQEHLEINGVVRADTADKPLTQSPIADEPYASVLVFRDPDNIQLELFAPPPFTGAVAMAELLAAAAWAGKIYSSGWVDGGGRDLRIG